MKIAAVIGSPVAQSLSPAIHNAVFDAHKDDWLYVAINIESGGVGGVLRTMRTQRLAALSVTMPLKEETCDSLEHVDDMAQLVHSVNTVVRQPDGTLLGATTDGDGCCNALVAAGAKLSGAKVVIIGAGGTARAVIGAMSKRGVSEIAVINRTASRSHEAVKISAVARYGIQSDLLQANIIVNTTPIGMGKTAVVDDPEMMPFDPSLLRKGQYVLDAVYYPLMTPLLRAAQNVEAIAVDGLDMLVHQAALQQQLWLNRLPDVAIMRAAALREIETRSARRAPIA